jgi:hypothetical protein
MQLFLVRLLLAFGLPWNFILWLIYIKPKKHQMFFGMEEALGILLYSIYGIIANIILVIIGVICSLA